MQMVQLALDNPAYRTALEAALFETGSWQVVPVGSPDPERSGVIVVDASALDRLAGLLAVPERVVLITGKDPKSLARAWDAGIISVVFEDEPISTAILAVMSAGLRVHSRTGPSGEPAREKNSSTPGECHCGRRRSSEEELQ